MALALQPSTQTLSNRPPTPDHQNQPARVLQLGRARPCPAVGVLEPHDVVQVRRRDLEDRRVLERSDAMHRPGPVAEGGAFADHLGVQERLPYIAQLEGRFAALDVPALVLLVVELQAEREACADPEDLADVELRVGPDQLPPPRLLDPARLEGPAVESLEVR